MNDDDNINILTTYEPKINKQVLASKINATLELYNAAESKKDKDEIAKRIIVYAKTLEQAIIIGHNGMTDLYDDKCDLEEKVQDLEYKLNQAIAIIKREHSSNPEILKEIDSLNKVCVPNKKGKRDYNNMINEYIFGAKKLKN